jgi:hypothetical protein
LEKEYCTLREDANEMMGIAEKIALEMNLAKMKEKRTEYCALHLLTPLPIQNVQHFTKQFIGKSFSGDIVKTIYILIPILQCVM